MFAARIALLIHLACLVYFPCDFSVLVGINCLPRKIDEVQSARKPFGGLSLSVFLSIKSNTTIEKKNLIVTYSLI